MISKENLDAIARKFGIGPYAKPKEADTREDKTILEEKDFFIFPNTPYAKGVIGDVYLTKDLLEEGEEKIHSQWKEWSLNNEEGIFIPNSQIIYQLMHRLYECREDESKIVKECIKGLHKDFDKYWLHTGTKINYGQELEATIEHLQPDKQIQSLNIGIPEFAVYDNNWSYLVLAKEQPETMLGEVEEIPDNAKPVLESLLGENYEKAGTVYQYIASRKNDLLREVRLWVPTEKNRNIERAVVLGVYVDVRFYINAVGNLDYDGPARGVRACAKKTP